MKNKRKSLVLGRLAEHLRSFYPELSHHFICPTCLVKIPLSKASQVSEAHIVPEAAGGSLKTYLCRDCNSNFGAKQDKWFGEYAHLRREKKDLLETRVKASYFEIDGIRYGGTFFADRQSGFKFYIDQTRTAPEALKELERRSRMEGFDGAKISIPIPLMANEAIIDVGFLTAAYLLWFHEFGYSWVLQDHLAIVRAQIREPEKMIIQDKYAVRCQGLYFDRPWVGVVRHQGEIVLVAAIADRMVSLPAVDRPGLPFADLSQPKGMFTAAYRRLDLYQQHRFEGPLAILFENRFLVMPDVLLRRSVDGHAIMYPAWTSAPVVMSFVSEEQATAISTLPNVQTVEAKYQPHIPPRDTGRPDGEND
ncbi:MAG TPA: HNH endonuclease [Thermoanaerobaculia bacterium]|nr:HNH endonuclease [Thermoanaerobaculia bacterium]